MCITYSKCPHEYLSLKVVVEKWFDPNTMTSLLLPVNLVFNSISNCNKYKSLCASATPIGGWWLTYYYYYYYSIK